MFKDIENLVDINTDNKYFIKYNFLDYLIELDKQSLKGKIIKTINGFYITFNKLNKKEDYKTSQELHNKITTIEIIYDIDKKINEFTRQSNTNNNDIVTLKNNTLIN